MKINIYPENVSNICIRIKDQNFIVRKTLLKKLNEAKNIYF